MSIAILPSAKSAWVRYCIGLPDVSVKDYTEGYALLCGPHAAEWLMRGFPEMYKAVRNSSEY